MQKFKDKLFSKNTILFLILILAAFLRLWKLNSVPPSVSVDEASIGYNAYSVLKTGLDEYGSFPLISQRGYDDWRRSTYLFLVTPFVKMLGLNAVSIRLPSAILSILTIWTTYLLIPHLFPKRTGFSQNMALLTAFLLAISPWHIYISRLGHESNAYFSFFMFGILFFFQGLKNKVRMLFSVVCFTLSTVSYYAGQAFVPLFAGSLILIYRENLLSMIRSNMKTLIALLIIMLALIPIFWTIFSSSAMIRFAGVSTFNPDAHFQEYSRILVLRNQAIQNRDFIGRIIYSDKLFPVGVFFEGYFSHYNFKWLYENTSNNEPFKVPGVGLLYVWEMVFGLIGIFTLLVIDKVDKKIKVTILLWFFLAPVPAAIGTGAPHAMRAYTFLTAWKIFIAFGLIYFLDKMKNFKILGLAIVFMLIFMTFKTFFYNYFIRFPLEQSDSFYYAASKAIPFIFTNQTKYKKIVVSNQSNLYQSYMLFLYYGRYDPATYQRTGGTFSGGYAEKHFFGKYEFRPINWDSDKLEKGVLYIGNSADFPKQIVPLRNFESLNGKVAIKAVGT